MTNFVRATRELRDVPTLKQCNINKPEGGVRSVLRNLTEMHRSNEKRRLPVYLFRSWPEISARVHAANQCALFLDFDGTVVKLRSRPEDTAISQRTRRVLEDLIWRHNVSISIVSGRRVEHLQRMIALGGIHYFGLHGAELQGKPLILHDDSVRVVRHALQKAQSQLGRLPGVWVEDKEFGFAVHYRKARPATVESANQILIAILAPHLNVIRILHGEKVWEILPREIAGKGPAVRELFEDLPKGTLVGFFGNDETDEPAFAALRDQITVRVGERRGTNARFYLHHPADVLRFLLRLEEELS